MTKFEVGKTYNAYGNSITISKRSEKTIWFCDDMFQARIKIINNIEAISPNIGLITRTYYANKGV